MKYEAVGYQSYRTDPKNGSERMANFVAKIVKETKYDDGMNTTSVLRISGEQPPKGDDQEPVKLPEIEISSEQFAAMNWVLPNWGVRCVILPLPGVKDDLRTMIQTTSEPEQETVYKFTGWQQINGKPKYLHKAGAIGATGNDPSVTVALPPELSRYDLTCPDAPADSVWAAIDLLGLCRQDVTWPLLAGALAPLYGPCDFGLHVTGKSGSGKSEMTALFLNLYGAGFDARHLPGNWASTANALEALAFFAKNAVFVIDDFNPVGSASQQKTYQQQADKIFRAQGNQAGRARLTDASSLQQVMYPRGVILSTGEDTPDGESLRARVMISEVAPGEIDFRQLTHCQEQRGRLCGVVAWLAQSLAKKPADLTPRANAVRDSLRDTKHKRTAPMVGRLVAVAEDVLTRWADAGLIAANEAASLKKTAYSSMIEAGQKQAAFMEGTDPVEMFVQALRQCLMSGKGYIRSQQGGIPRKADMLGWVQDGGDADMPTYKAKGQLLGWVNSNKDELYIDTVAGVPSILSVAGSKVSLNVTTLFKRMKDAGTLKRTDSRGGRNIIRVTCDGNPRQVLCMSLGRALGTNGGSGDESGNDSGDDTGTGDDTEAA